MSDADLLRGCQRIAAYIGFSEAAAKPAVERHGYACEVRKLGFSRPPAVSEAETSETGKPRKLAGMKTMARDGLAAGGAKLQPTDPSATKNPREL